MECGQTRRCGGGGRRHSAPGLSSEQWSRTSSAAPDSSRPRSSHVSSARLGSAGGGSPLTRPPPSLASTGCRALLMRRSTSWAPRSPPPRPSRFCAPAAPTGRPVPRRTESIPPPPPPRSQELDLLGKDVYSCAALTELPIKRIQSGRTRVGSCERTECGPGRAGGQHAGGRLADSSSQPHRPSPCRSKPQGARGERPPCARRGLARGKRRVGGEVPPPGSHTRPLRRWQPRSKPVAPRPRLLPPASPCGLRPRGSLRTPSRGGRSPPAPRTAPAAGGPAPAGRRRAPRSRAPRCEARRTTPTASGCAGSSGCGRERRRPVGRGPGPEASPAAGKARRARGISAPAGPGDFCRLPTPSSPEILEGILPLSVRGLAPGPVGQAGRGHHEAVEGPQPAPDGAEDGAQHLGRGVGGRRGGAPSVTRLPASPGLAAGLRPPPQSPGQARRASAPRVTCHCQIALLVREGQWLRPRANPRSAVPG